MDDLAGKIGAAGGLLSSTMTGSVAYLVGLKQRRLTVRLAENKDLDDFINDAAEYGADAERLIDITQEIYGNETVTCHEPDNIFKLHLVDAIPSTAKLLQRASDKLSQSALDKQRVSVAKRRALALAYKNLLFAPDQDAPDVMVLMRSLIGEVHLTTAVASQALQEEIAIIVMLKRPGRVQVHHPCWQQLGFAPNYTVSRRAEGEIHDWQACDRAALVKMNPSFSGRKNAGDQSTERKQQIFAPRGPQ